MAIMVTMVMGKDMDGEMIRDMDGGKIRMAREMDGGKIRMDREMDGGKIRMIREMDGGTEMDRMANGALKVINPILRELRGHPLSNNRALRGHRMGNRSLNLGHLPR